MKKSGGSTRKEARVVHVGMTINIGAPPEVGLQHAAERAQEQADIIGEDVHITEGFTGKELGLVRPRRKNGVSVSMAGLAEGDYERIFKHTKFVGNGNEKVQ